MKLFESFPDLKKRYWGRHFWAQCYFCVTSGELADEMINNYLEHHFELKRDDNFRITFNLVSEILLKLDVKAFCTQQSL